MSKKPKVSEKAREAMNVSIEIVKNMTKEELNHIAENNSCVRGMVTGYTCEYHLGEFLKSIDGVTEVYKPDDHDRTKNKSDYIVTYKGRKIRIQSKSIQTDSIREDNGVYTAKIQNDSSDKHDIILPTGKKIQCTNYMYGGYDILATCLVNFTKKMDFCFKLNSECAPAKGRNIPQEDRKYLMSTTEKLTYPISDGWSTDIVEIMNRVGENLKIKDNEPTVEQMVMDL